MRLRSVHCRVAAKPDRATSPTLPSRVLSSQESDSRTCRIVFVVPDDPRTRNLYHGEPEASWQLRSSESNKRGGRHAQEQHSLEIDLVPGLLFAVLEKSKRASV